MFQEGEVGPGSEPSISGGRPVQLRVLRKTQLEVGQGIGEGGKPSVPNSGASCDLGGPSPYPLPFNERPPPISPRRGATLPLILGSDEGRRWFTASRPPPHPSLAGTSSKIRLRGPP